MRALAVAAAATTAAATAPAPPSGFKSWTVTTLQKHEGTSVTLLWSKGQNIEVSSTQGVVCIVNQKVLAPVAGSNVTGSIRNYTSGKEYMHNQDSGGNDECTNAAIPKGAIPESALAWFSPTAAQLAGMQLVSESVPCDTQTCRQWHYLGSKDAQGTNTEIFYFTRTSDDIPMQISNQTHWANGTWTEMTTAFDGNTVNQDISHDCTQLLSCGPLHCVADPNAQETQLTAATTWACGDGGVDCAEISKGGPLFYPDNPYAHANYVYDAYYHQHISGGAGSCDFSGTAMLTRCKGSCQTCNATSSATEADMTTALSWACSDKGIDACNYPAGLADTTRAKLDWAMTTYYNAYQCSGSPASDSADSACAVPAVPGLVQVLPCGATPAPTPPPGPATPAPPVPPTPAPAPVTPPPAPPASWRFVCNGGLCQRAQYGATWDDCQASCGH